MKSEIKQISEVFSLSKSDATVILISLRWNSFKASDRLGDDKEKLMGDLGLVKVNSSNQKNESVSSFADQENLVSTPFSPHKFSEPCWISYLNNLLENNKEEEIVLCPNPNCVASVGPDTIEKLTEPAVKEMYKRYVLGSFVEANNESIKWCPAPGCEYAIERHEDLMEDDESSLDFGVVCSCGHTFCWSCNLESHRPVTCKDASLWFSSILDTLKNNAWLVKNTKRCPRCNTHVQRTDDLVLRMITFVASVGAAFACHEDLEKSKLDLKAIDENGIPIPTSENYFSFSDGDVDAVMEATLLMVQCRLVLKWSCAYEYFITMHQSAKTQYVKHLRGEATKTLVRHRATQEELMNQALFWRFQLLQAQVVSQYNNHW
ncbi:hypothetical protein Bca52824_001034 [Brassica carinata]|uniref:RBR-type E3 ubiquitin transferase n=1 Tax=Brassica carinata TaxID=52824 RepID=A0A8X7WHJ9_BRACI|nr:hypothetical protein Bca52824_001034 [Brassica carinata]